MSSTSHSIPVRQLFTQGDPDFIQDWSIYLSLGIKAMHVHELAKIALDRQLLESEEASGWAPIHAWRTLGMLGGEAAILPLIAVLRQLSIEEQAVDLDEIPDFDWVSEELPLVFGRIGPIALPALKECLFDTQASNRSRENAVISISEIGLEHPQTRLNCIVILTQQLEQFEANTPSLNNCLVTLLIGKLSAIESADVLEQVFLANRVSFDLIENWDDAKMFLGLAPLPDFSPRSSTSPTSQPNADSAKTADKVPFYSTIPKSKSQAKRKVQSQSRKKNRPKK